MEFQENVGFSPGHVMKAGQFGENVDVTTGNLTLTVPIGPRYQVNDLSYGIILTYNSKIWEYESPLAVSCNYGMPGCDYEALEKGRRPYLKTDSPFGLGWTYHEGRMFVDPNTPFPDASEAEGLPRKIHYEAPDGSQHELYRDTPDPRFDDPNHPVPSGPPYYYYSKDSSYLRARPYTVYKNNDEIAGETMLIWKLWEPDGTSRILGHQLGTGQQSEFGGSGANPALQGIWSTAGWYTIRRESPRQRAVGDPGCTSDDALFLHGPVGGLNGSEPYAGAGSGVTNWVRDGAGVGSELWEVPCNYIEFFYTLSGTPPLHSFPQTDEATYVRFIKDSADPSRLTQIQAGLANGGVSFQLPGITGTYDLDLDEDVWIDGPRSEADLYFEDAQGDCILSGTPDPEAAVQENLLREITYPPADNGERYTMQFGYEHADCNNNGVVTERVLPTGARTEYEYMNYYYKSGTDMSFSLTKKTYFVAGRPPAVWEYARDPIQVLGRVQLVDPGGVDVELIYVSTFNETHWPLQPHSFDPSIWQSSNGAYSNPPRVWEVDPDGNTTVYTLYSNKNDQASSPMPEYYGRILARSRLRGTSEAGAPLGVELYGHGYDPDETFDFPTHLQPSQQPAYGLTQDRPVNIRQTEKLIRLYDGEGFGKDWRVTYDDFDAFGNAQKTTEYLAGSTEQVHRFVETKRLLALPGSSTVSVVGAGTFLEAQRKLYDRWILGVATSTEMRTSDGGPVVTRSVTTSLDAFGAPLQSTTYADPVAQTGGVTSFNEFTPYGALDLTKTQTVVQGQNQIRMVDIDVNAAGQVLSKTFGHEDALGVANWLPWKAFDRDIDLATGRVAATRSPAGIQTSYSYDALGRLTEISPSGTEYSTSIDYASIQLTVVSQGPAGDNIESRYHYDEAGALTKQEQVDRDGSFNKKTIAHDVSGRVTFESVWVPSETTGTLPGTTTEYWVPIVGSYGPIDPGATPGSYTVDPKGRKTRVIGPDGAVTEWLYDGLETHITQRDLNQTPDGAVTSPQGAPMVATTILLNDEYGRLVHVAAASGQDAAYEYDHQDNLVRVDMGAQVRTFGYDGMGRLLFASNPENGLTTYADFDTGGQPLSVVDTLGQTTALTYDDAGRLLTSSIDGVLRASYVYDEPTVVNSEAQLTSATSYKEDGSFALRRNLGYSGLNGRLSHEFTVLLDPLTTVETPTITRYYYNDFGLPSAVLYPEIGAATHAALLLNYDYSHGLLDTAYDANTLDEFVSSITYNPAGGVRLLSYGNGASTETTPDIMNRPDQIEIRAWAQMASSLDAPGGDGLRIARTEPRPAWVQRWLDSRPSATPESEESDFPRPLPSDLIAQFLPPPGGGGGGSPPVLTTVLDTGTYRYDGAGNIIQIGSDAFSYDALSRLTTAHVTHPEEMATSVTDLTYGYDGFGNMTSRSKQVDSGNLATWAFGVHISNQVQSLAFDAGTGNSIDNYQRSYLFDEVGNLREVQIPGATEGQIDYVFDKTNRLVEARIHEIDPQTLGGEVTALGTYTYDERGYRIRKVEDGVETFYIRDVEGRVLSEFRRAADDTGFPAWDQDYVYAVGGAIATIKNREPVSPANLHVESTFGVDIGVTLTWDRGDEEDLWFYEVWRQTGTGAFENITNVTAGPPGGSMSYDDLGLVMDDYEYYLVAVDTAWLESTPSRSVRICNGGCADVLATFASSTGGDRTVALAWTVNGDEATILGYDVWRSQLQTSGYNRVNNELLTSKSFFDTAIVNNTTYYYRVTVKTTTNSPSPSDVGVETTSITPQDAVSPPAPANVQLTPSDTGWWVFWEPSNAPDLVEYRFTNGAGTFNHVEPAGVSQTHLVDTTQAGSPDPNWDGLAVHAIDDDGNASATVAVARPMGKSLGGWPRFERDWWIDSTTGPPINNGPRTYIYSFGAFRYPTPGTLEEIVAHREHGIGASQEWSYGYPSEFVGTSLEVTMLDQFDPSSVSECPYFKVYRSSPENPVWVELTTDWQIGTPPYCEVEIEDRFLVEPSYTYYVVSAGTQLGGAENIVDLVDFTYRYEADEVMGLQAFGARLAQDPDDPSILAIDPDEPGWELGGTLAGEPIVVRWRKSLHSDVVGYRIWAYDQGRVGAYGGWTHLGDVPATESIFLDYGAPCAWPVEYLTQNPSQWNEYTCTLKDAGEPYVAGCWGHGNLGALVRYYVEGLTDPNAPLATPEPSVGWDQSSNVLWREQVRAAKLCAGACPKTGSDCPTGASWTCRCTNYPPVSQLDDEVDDEAEFLFASMQPIPEASPVESGKASSGPSVARLPAVVGFLEIEVIGGAEFVSEPQTVTRQRPAPDRLVGQATTVADIQWLHTDHLGSTRIVTDEDGLVVSEHKYYPFGEEFFPNVVQTDEVNTHKFTGHERDRKTGLDYMMARYYAPEDIYRFLSVDPSLASVSHPLPATWNRYVYVRHNPLSRIDPTGMTDWSLPPSVSGFVSDFKNAVVTTGQKLRAVFSSEAKGVAAAASATPGALGLQVAVHGTGPTGTGGTTSSSGATTIDQKLLGGSIAGLNADITMHVDIETGEVSYSASARNPSGNGLLVDTNLRGGIETGASLPGGADVAVQHTVQIDAPATVLEVKRETTAESIQKASGEIRKSQAERTEKRQLEAMERDSRTSR